LVRTFTPSEIRSLRERLDMSQAEFAKAFHLSVRTVQKWEQGSLTPSGPTAVLLWLIDHIPQQILKALRGDEDRPGGARK
jgi:putative transcriptional regulator